MRTHARERGRQRGGEEGTSNGAGGVQGWGEEAVAGLGERRSNGGAEVKKGGAVVLVGCRDGEGRSALGWGRCGATTACREVEEEKIGDGGDSRRN
jgi:hypothetical protein